MSGDKRLSYLVAGEGRPIVLLPGWMMDAEWWVEDGYVAALGTSYRVIAVDPLGLGRSDRPLDLDAYSDEAIFEHLAAIISAESASGCALWGYGNGASHAQLFARRRPSEIAAVVCGGYFLGGKEQALEDDVYRHNTELVLALESDDWDKVWEFVPGLSPEQRDRVRGRTDPRALTVLLRSVLVRAEGFRASPVPTFAYWGKGASYHQRNLELAESLPIEAAVLEGDRYEVFADCESTLGVVLPFLARAFGAVEA